MALASRMLSLALATSVLALGLPARAADVIDDWAQVQAPAAPTAYFLGYQVIVPVDGISSRAPYADQSTIYTFAAAPVMGGKVKLTRTNMMKF